MRDLNDICGSIIAPNVVYGTEYHIEIHYGEQRTHYEDGGKPFFRCQGTAERAQTVVGGIFDSEKELFHVIVILAVRHPQVPVLHNPEGLKDETMWIVVTARGVEQPAVCHQ